jgi:phenylacetic acid degradation protein
MPVYQIDGLTPVVDPSSYVHPTAVLIGDVIVGKQVYIGPNASLRGDFGRLVIGDGANIQDNCVMHGFPQQDTWWNRTVISATVRYCTAVVSAVTPWSA